MRMQTKRKDGIIISTVTVEFLAWYGEYETAISLDGFDWRILEGYNTKEKAIAGHNKYVNMPKKELMEFDYIG